MSRLTVQEDLQPLPTDGLEVQELRDEDTARLFRQAWRERLIREARQAQAPCDGRSRKDSRVRSA